MLLPFRSSDLDAVVKLSEASNVADLRNVCTEAGLFFIRAERAIVINEDRKKDWRSLTVKRNMKMYNCHD